MKLPAQTLALLFTTALTLAQFGTPQALHAADNPIKGKEIFQQCAACHQLGEDAEHAVGPSLNHVFGRMAGTADGFTFSDPMRTQGDEGLLWTEKTLYIFLAGPDRYVPGTSMGFAGLRTEQEIRDLMAFLIDFSPAYAKGSEEPVSAEAASAAALPTYAGDTVEEAPDFTAEFLTQSDAIANGGELWAGQCRHCHGSSAYPGKAPKLTPARYKPDFVFDRVTNGFKKMPPWKTVFSLEQRMHIVAYVMSDRFSP